MLQQPINILITGGAGFIGGNFINYFSEKYPNYNIINLDLLTYASNLSYIEKNTSNPNYTFIKGDILDTALLTSLFKEKDIRGIIHFAAESHVDNSILNPDVFVKTNVLGTFNLLNAAKNYWFTRPFEFKQGYEKSLFYHISTDEVYGTLGIEGFFTEDTPYAPNSPYSASKASSDMLVRSYFHTFGLPTIISNCSNNYGPNQHKEKLIPTIIRKALALEPIPIYGNGKNVRDWLYVIDHCEAIDLLFHKGKHGETYNIGGDCERENLSIAETICELLDKESPRQDGLSYREQINFVKDRPGHDFRYAIDHTKLTTQFGWNPKENISSGLQKTVRYYLDIYKK